MKDPETDLLNEYSQNFSFEAASYDSGKRADVFLTSVIEESSRSYISKQIEEGRLKVNGKTSKASLKLKEGDIIEFTFSPLKEIEALPQDIPLEIMYEDDDIAVVNKPSGMVVHPCAGTPDGTMVNALLFRIRNLSSINGVIRPGIVHRIDKDTSGILVVAKTDNAHRKLTEQLSDHSMVREYTALCDGRFKETEGTVRTYIGRDKKNRLKMAVTPDGKEAVTHYRVIREFRDMSLLKVRLETGRTHQIRVHMAYIGHPVVKDPIYGLKVKGRVNDGQLLHAGKLGFIHPSTGEYMEFNAEPEKRFTDMLLKAEKGMNQN